MVLHAGPHTAGEAAEHVLVFAAYTLPDRHHVAHAAVVGIDRAEHVIEQGALMEFRVFDVGSQREQSPGHLEHVVDVARLGRPAVHDVAQLVGLAKILILAVTACRETVMMGHPIPEIARGKTIADVTRVHESRKRPQQLWNCRVAMHPAERIFMALERVQNRPMLEAIREREPSLVAGVGVEVGEDFVHPAELGIQHFLRLHIIEP
jgi:hypothetical protein